MRFKTTWLFIALFAALVAYLYFVENPARRAREEAKEREGIAFPDFSTEAVTEISLAGSRGKARAKKGEDGVWVVVEPWEDGADAARIAGLLSDLKALRTFKEVAAADADPEPFGLATPEVTVRAIGGDATLLIGAENPAGDARYVRANGGPVQVAKAHGLTKFLSDPSDLRSKDLVSEFPWGRLRSIEVRPAEGEAIGLAREGDTWALVEPIEVEADPEAAQRLADKLRYARITGFLDEDADRWEDELARGITVTLAAQGGEEPVTVRMAEVDGAVWADRSGRRALVTLSEDVLKGFQVTADELRRKRPVLAKPWKLARVDVTLPGAKLAYEKVDGAWRRGGAPVPADEGSALQDFLRDLETGKADRVIDQPGPDSEYGLDKPDLGVRIAEPDGKEQSLAVSRKGETVFARSGDLGVVFEMPAGYLSSAEEVLEASRAGAADAKEAK